MAVFSEDACPNERGQLGSHATARVVPGTLEDRGPFSGRWVLPDLADLYRCAIRRAVRFGCDMKGGVSSSLWPLGLFSGSTIQTCVLPKAIPPYGHRKLVKAR